MGKPELGHQLVTKTESAGTFCEPDSEWEAPTVAAAADGPGQERQLAIQGSNQSLRLPIWHSAYPPTPSLVLHLSTDQLYLVQCFGPGPLFKLKILSETSVKLAKM